MSRRVAMLVVVVLCGVTAGLPAQGSDALLPGEEADAAGPRPSASASSGTPWAPNWGLSSTIAYNIPGWEFNNLRDAQHGRSSPGSYIYHSGGTSTIYDATFHLPSGALIYNITPFIYDNDPTSNVTVWVYRCEYTGFAPPNPSCTSLLSVSSNGTPGFWGQNQPLPVPETVRNAYPLDFSLRFYLVTVNINPSASAFDLAFGGITIWYKLQASPAPATATFGDVSVGHPFFQYIEALAASEITAGCGSGNYCPDDPVTRGQMAVFLTKALGLHWAY